MDHVLEEDRVIIWSAAALAPRDDEGAATARGELGPVKRAAAARICQFLTHHYGIGDRCAAWLDRMIRREAQCSTACWPGGALLQDFQPRGISTPIHRSWVDWWAFLAPQGFLGWESLDGHPTYVILAPVFRRPHPGERSKAYYAGQECLRVAGQSRGGLAEVARRGCGWAAAILTHGLLEGRSQRDAYWNFEPAVL